MQVTREVTRDLDSRANRREVVRLVKLGINGPLKCRIAVRRTSYSH